MIVTCQTHLAHRLCLTRTQDFIAKKKDYLQTQVGNPEGADKPNKKVRKV